MAVCLSFYPSSSSGTPCWYAVVVVELTPYIISPAAYGWGCGTQVCLFAPRSSWLFCRRRHIRARLFGDNGVIAMILVAVAVVCYLSSSRELKACLRRGGCCLSASSSLAQFLVALVFGFSFRDVRDGETGFLPCSLSCPFPGLCTAQQYPRAKN